MLTVWHLVITVRSPYNPVRGNAHRLTPGYHGTQSLLHITWKCSPFDPWLSRYAGLITQYVEMLNVWHLVITVRSPYYTLRGTAHRLTPYSDGAQSPLCTHFYYYILFTLFSHLSLNCAKYIPKLLKCALLHAVIFQFVNSSFSILFYTKLPFTIFFLLLHTSSIYV